MANVVADVANTFQGANDSELMVCSICGESHLTDSCRLLGQLKPVKDTPTISRARLTLPSGLKVVSLADGTTTVVACTKFERGTHFGPFQAPLTTDLHPGVALPLKITGKLGNDSYYLDATDEETCNWMCLVAPASTASEQNLICYDMKQSIYFTAIKDILIGDELRVWYAVYYGLKLQALPLADESETKEGLMDLPGNNTESKLKIKSNMGQEIGRELLESLAQHLPAHSLGVRVVKDRWQCRFCNQEEANVSHYAKHLLSHYRPKCELCNRRFCTQEALSKHQKIKHVNSKTGTTPHQHIEDTIENAPPCSLDKKNQDDKETKENEIWKKNELNPEEIIIPNDKISSENHGIFCPLTSVDGGSQDIITINNVNSSEVVETQLALADDGSVVYHVTNIPDGILATEMDKLGLLVVDNENCLEAAERWSDGPNQDPTLESGSAENPHNNGETRVEPFIKDAKIELGNESAVSLILLDTLQNDNQKNEDNQQELREQGTTLRDVDTQMIDKHDGDINSQRDQKGPFACDICSKPFEKIRYLLRHLKKHTGEFTCVHCLGVFARKENLQSHWCTRSMVRHPCHICGKKFKAKKYLQRHVRLHTGKFRCEKCKRSFVSKPSLAYHRCRPQDLSKDSMKCSLCGQTFPDQIKLHTHLMHHSETDKDGHRAYLRSTPVTRKLRRRKPKSRVAFDKKPELSISLGTNLSTSNISEITALNLAAEENNSTANEKSFICEICGLIFKSFSSMKTHGFLHGERRFECKICGKRFHRKDVLQDHITVHQGAQLPCSECGKKFKTKKSLEVHVLIHVGAKRFACNECDKKFHQKGNLLKHQRVHTSPADRIFPCQHCNKSFTSKEYYLRHTLEHTQGKLFQCRHCLKSFVEKHLLESHEQSTHSSRAFLCRYCNNVMRYRHSARRHLQQQHSDKRSEWSQPGFVDLMLAELPTDSLLLNNGGLLAGQQAVQQEDLLSPRRQHFGNLNAGKEDINPILDHVPMEVQETISVANKTAKNIEHQDLVMEDVASFTLEEVELLADPLLSTGNSQVQLDGINVVPISFEKKKQGEEIILAVPDPQLQGSLIVPQNSTDTMPITSSDTPEENAQVTIGGNTYIVQDRVIFEDDEMSSGDIFLYVLDSASQE